MTKAGIERLIERAKTWPIGNSGYDLIQTLAQNYLAALEVIKYYRGSDDDETSWMEPDQHLMYWTLWNDGDCVGGKVADDFLKKVGCE